jgi:hypothetical protein
MIVHPNPVLALVGEEKIDLRCSSTLYFDVKAGPGGEDRPMSTELYTKWEHPRAAAASMMALPEHQGVRQLWFHEVRR